VKAIQLDHYVLCEVRGLTVNQAADCLDILPGSIRAVAGRYGLKFAPMPHSRNRKAIVYQGVEYPSQDALARATGVSDATIWYHIKRGSLDRINATDGKRIVKKREKIVEKIKLSASPKAVAKYIKSSAT